MTKSPATRELLCPVGGFNGSLLLRQSVNCEKALYVCYCKPFLRFIWVSRCQTVTVLLISQFLSITPLCRMKSFFLTLTNCRIMFYCFDQVRLDPAGEHRCSRVIPQSHDAVSSKSSSLESLFEYPSSSVSSGRIASELNIYSILAIEVTPMIRKVYNRKGSGRLRFFLTRSKRREFFRKYYAFQHSS